MAEDEGGHIIVANHAFSRMFGLPVPEELVGTCAHVVRERVWRDLMPQGDLYRSMTFDLRQRREPQLGFEVVMADGRIFDRDYVPVAAPDGTIVHMWHYRDVTERRQLELRLRESSRRL